MLYTTENVVTHEKSIFTLYLHIFTGWSECLTRQRVVTIGFLWADKLERFVLSMGQFVSRYAKIARICGLRLY